MSKNGNGEDHGLDFIADGWLTLNPQHAVRAKPIKWGVGYLRRSNEEKIAYLEKLASSMNQALEQIQKERNHWGQKAEQKEAQVIELSRRLNQNNDVLQSEITRMNEERQVMRAEMAKLKHELREAQKV